MKFKASRGGSAERENKRSRESAAGHFDRKMREERQAKMKALRAAAKIAKATVRARCKHRRGDARLRAAEGRREVARDVKLRLEEELAEIDHECARRMAEDVGPINLDIQGLAAEIRASALARRHGREREKARPKATAAERKSEAYDRARKDIEAHDRRLLPVFERVKGQLKPTERQTLTEAFLELVAETPELLEQEQRRAESQISDLDLHCAEAIHEGKLGNEEARAWAAQHCTGRRRSKGSAASRTIAMFGPTLVPPEARSAAPQIAAPEPKPKPTRKGRGQQTLSGGALGASFLDKIPF